MKKMCLLLIALVFYFPAFTLAIGEVKEKDLNYRLKNEIIASIKIDVPLKKFFLKIKNLTVINQKLMNQYFKLKKGYIYHTDSYSAYAEGYTQREFEDEIQSAVHSASFYFYQIFVPQAWSDDGCTIRSNQIDNFSTINHEMKLTSFTNILGTCDYSISNIIEEQLNQTKNLASDIVSGDIWKKVSDAVISIHDLIPQLYDQLIIPMGNLISVVPEIAKHLICDFAESKFSNIAFVALTGGSSLVSTVVRTGIEATELVHKVKVLQKNEKALRLIQQLQQRNLLDKEIIEKILKFNSDVPVEHKGLNVRFRTDKSKIKHFEKHGEEMGFQNISDYEEAAQKFLKSPGNKNTVSYQQSGGDLIKLDFEIEEYIVTNKYGNIISYYKLTCKNEYDKILYILYEKEAKDKGVCLERN